MRIWDVEPSCLCRRHLVGEHGELHALWSVLTDPTKRGFQQHPETLRWRGKLAALYQRHALLVEEFGRRGYRHATPLDERLATGAEHQDVLITPIEEQHALLRAKGCDCPHEPAIG